MDPRLMIDPGHLLSPRRLFFFEKWYFDGQTSDGGFFLAYLAPLTLLGSAGAELVVCLFPPAGGQVRVSQHLRGRDLELDPGRAWARFPGGELSLAPQGCRLRVQGGGVDLEVEYRPLDPPFSPDDGGLMASQGGHALRWVVPVPRAQVNGTVEVRGVRLALEAGQGYSDFVQTDIPPWALPVRELLWGRALGPETTLVWNRLGLRSSDGRGINRTCRWLSQDAQGRRSAEGLWVTFQREQDHPRTRDRYPTDLSMTLDGDGSGATELRLGDTRLLLGDFVADVQSFNTEIERELYRTFTGNPVEYKLFSRVLGTEALAAHEWVLWGRGR